MLLSQAIIAAISDAEVPSLLKWSQIYAKWNHTSDLSDLVKAFFHWKQIRNPSEFRDFFLDHPEFGCIAFDSKNRPRIIHAIKHADDNTFIGVFHDLVTSPPLEFEIKNSILNHRFPFAPHPKPNTPNKSPARSVSTSTNHDQDDNDLPASPPTHQFDTSSTWDHCSSHTVLPSKINSILIAHPSILHILLKSPTALDPKFLQPALTTLFHNTLRKLKDSPDIHHQIESLYLYLATTLRFTQMSKLSHINIEPSLHPPSGLDHLVSFTPGLNPLSKTSRPPSNSDPDPNDSDESTEIIPISFDDKFTDLDEESSKIKKSKKEKKRNISFDHQPLISPSPRPSIRRSTKLPSAIAKHSKYDCLSTNTPQRKSHKHPHKHQSRTHPKSNKHRSYHSDSDNSTSSSQTSTSSSDSSSSDSPPPPTKRRKTAPPSYKKSSPSVNPFHLNHSARFKKSLSSHVHHKKIKKSKSRSGDRYIHESESDSDSSSFEHRKPRSKQNNKYSHKSRAIEKFSSSSKPSKKTLFTKLSDAAKLIFCRIACYEEGDEDPSQPSPTCLSLFSESTSSKVPSHISAASRRAGARGSWQHGHLTWIAYQGLLWPSDTEPEGLTFFAIIPYSDVCSSARQKEIKTRIKTNYDNNLAESDIEFMSKQEFFFPETIHDFEVQMVTYITFIGIISHPQSFLTTQLTTWIDHLQKHWTVYESQSRKSIWLTKLLFSIDLLVQEQLQLLQDEFTPLEEISFHPITDGFRELQRTVLRRNLATTLPDSLIQTRSASSKKDKKDNQSESSKKDTKSDKSKSTARKDYQSPAVNPRPNEQWILPNDKSFREVFITSKLIDDTPKYKDTPFCLQFHTKGSCSRGNTCRLIHDDPRDVKLDKNFYSFISKALNHNSSTQDQTQTSDK
jgi:hypothetical protein